MSTFYFSNEVTYTQKMVAPIRPINTQVPIAMIEYRIGLDKPCSSVLEGLGISERKC